MNDIDEQPLMFGPEGRLFGVTTAPHAAGTTSLACLMLNMGTTHRIGPHRLNVKLSRRLARQGVTSLRFDLSGVGDSPAARSTAHFRDQAVQDMKAAMDHIEMSAGIRRFVIFGMCSGAVNGYSLALSDARVVGLLMFDGFAYPSLRARFDRNWHRLRAMPSNPAVVDKTGRWAKRLFGASSRERAGIFDVDGTSKPAPAEFTKAVDELLARGVSLYLIYSGTLHARDRDHDQLSAFGNAPFVERIRYEFMGDVDHTVVSIAAQQKLMSAVCDWVDDVADAQA